MTGLQILVSENKTTRTKQEAVTCKKGCIAFMKRGLPGYMTGSTMFAFFDYSEPLIFFILDYLAVMILFMTVGCLVIRILNKVDKAQKEKTED